jgi:hypothetical protein
MKDRRSKGRIGGPFVPMIKSTMSSPAWRARSHGARSLYTALRAKYNSKLQNGVYLSERCATKELGSFSSRDSVRRWFRELQYYGFIFMETGACLGVEGRGKAPHYRLTEEFYLGQRPTRDFERWDGTKYWEQKPPSYYKHRRAFVSQKKQNPGLTVQSTVVLPSSPLEDKIAPKKQSGWSYRPVHTATAGWSYRPVHN